jgi:hypothetical protein
MQVAQATGFDIDSFTERQTGRTELDDVTMQVREGSGRVLNSIRELFQEVSNKLLRLLQGGRQ